MRMCAELADLGMQLARAAAARALADWAEPEEPPTAEPLTNPAAEPPTNAAAEPPTNAAAEPPNNAAPAPQPNTLPNATPRRTAGTTTHKPTDPALLFTRLAATVRDCIALETRLADSAHAGTRLSALRADPRRASLHEGFRRATASHPDHTILLRQATDRVDAELAADPHQSLRPHRIFFAVCKDIGFKPDLATLPNEMIGLYADRPQPRATDPP